MIESDDDTCQTCRFSLAYDDDQDACECRRYPPVPLIGDGEEMTAFPVTMASWWCGEFARRVN